MAANHLSFLDPPLIGAFAPRPICYLARKTLFKNPLAATMLRGWNVVPMDRERGDVAGLRAVLDLLSRGEAVVVFPEGTRGKEGELQPAQSGFGWLVAKSGAPVLPVRISGTGNAMPRGVLIPRPRQVGIRFGELMRFEQPIPSAKTTHGAAAKVFYEQIATATMAAIANLKGGEDRESALDKQ